MSRYYDYYPPYVSVAEKKVRNAKMAAKLAKTNPNLKPIVLQGKTIASTFWGKSWCKNVESYQDYSNRLSRGRSYIREGAILDLQITAGKVTALVAGSARVPYEIAIDIQPLAPEKWEALKQKCVGKISSLLALIQGKLPPEVIKEFCSQQTGLFPTPKEIKMSCSCPDYAGLCKHLAAVLFGIGARLDEDPTLFFTLRKIDGNELIQADVASTLTQGVESEIADSDLENVFGVSFDEVPEPDAAPAKPQPPKPTAKKQEETKTATKKTTAKTPQKETKWTARKLTSLRKKLGFSQLDLAKHLGLSTQTIINWENSKYDIRAKYFERLNQLNNTK